MALSNLAMAVHRAREALASDYAAGAILSLVQAERWITMASEHALPEGQSLTHYFDRKRLVDRILDETRQRVVEKWGRATPKRGRPAKVRTTEVRRGA